MSKYAFTAVVKRVVTDTISLHVNADSEAEAREIAERVLDKFPKMHTDGDVPYCYIENRDYHNNEIVSLSDQEDVGVA